ncbi:MAG: HEAT repeat domain-containing protein [Actinomycetes bacterium]
MAARADGEATPRARVERECARRGKPAVVTACRRLIREEPVDPSLLISMNGPGAEKFFDGQPHDDVYWFRVWGARGLLWAWDPVATDDIRQALDDEHWRVREMALKVMARHRVGDLLEHASRLRDDPVPRVRAAADRAIVTLTQAQA